MKLNFQLFDNFKEAALRCDLEVIPGKGYHTIRLPNGRYIFCWTPLNKIWELFNYYEKQQWDRALNNLRQNFSDFHLEFGGDTIEDMNVVCECFLEESYKNRLKKVFIDALQWAKSDNRRACIGFNYDDGGAWVAGALPTYIIEALVYNSFEIDIDSLNRYVSDGLNLADPEAALKKYQSKHQSK